MQLKKEIKFETLKKSHKKQIIIGSVLVCVVGSILTFNLTKAKYRVTQSMKLVTGTINYKVPDMRVVALYTENDKNEYVESDDVPTSGYTLNEEKSLCRVYDGTTSVAEAPKDELITIEYKDGRIYINDLTKKNTRCYLYFDKYEPPITIPDIIASFGSNLKTGNPDFTKMATGAETEENNGIYKASDPMYGENAETYYWRGAATSNHLIFANYCWRIVRINGNESIRLIYNGAVQSNNSCLGNGANTSTTAVTSQAYNASSNNSAYVGYTYTASVQRPTPTTGGTESNLKTQTDTWYNNNIGNNVTYAGKVADGKYCNDRTIGSGTWRATGSTFYYGAYTRLNTNYTPTLSCDASDVYTLKAGAITADEVAYAGGLAGTNNQSYYLYNGQSYWTMSPSHWYSSSSSVRVFYVRNIGSLTGTSANDTIGVRPVINLRSDVTFNAGSNGTQNNPYIVQ